MIGHPNKSSAQPDRVSANPPTPLPMYEGTERKGGPRTEIKLTSIPLLCWPVRMEWMRSRDSASLSEAAIRASWASRYLRTCWGPHAEEASVGLNVDDVGLARVLVLEIGVHARHGERRAGRRTAARAAGCWARSSARPARLADGAVTSGDPTIWRRLDSCVTAISSSGSRPSRLTSACWRRRRTSRSCSICSSERPSISRKIACGVLRELKQAWHEGQRVRARDRSVSLISQMSVHQLHDFVIKVGPPASHLGIFRPPGH